MASLLDFKTELILSLENKTSDTKFSAFLPSTLILFLEFVLPLLTRLNFFFDFWNFRYVHLFYSWAWPSLLSFWLVVLCHGLYYVSFFWYRFRNIFFRIIIIFPIFSSLFLLFHVRFNFFIVGYYWFGIVFYFFAFVL
eukprot:UN32557